MLIHQSRSKSSDFKINLIKMESLNLYFFNFFQLMKMHKIKIKLNKLKIKITLGQ